MARVQSKHVENDTGKISLRFQVLDETIVVETGRLPERVRMDELLPVLKILDDQAIGIAVRKNGQPVSCAKGCSMCCRIQLVPVTPVEAYALLCLVEALPEPERTEVLSRFSDRVERLKTAGLADDYLGRREPATPEPARIRAIQYLDLQLACPFLEDDACSIYEARPFACREYLVTSPKELCARPLSEPIQRVPVILIPANATVEAASPLGLQPRDTIPLTLALIYAEAHREELERSYPSAQVLAQSIQRIFTAAYLNGSLPAGAG